MVTSGITKKFLQKPKTHNAWHSSWEFQIRSILGQGEKWKRRNHQSCKGFDGMSHIGGSYRKCIAKQMKELLSWNFERSVCPRLVTKWFFWVSKLVLSVIRFLKSIVIWKTCWHCRNHTCWRVWTCSYLTLAGSQPAKIATCCASNLPKLPLVDRQQPAKIWKKYTAKTSTHQ